MKSRVMLLAAAGLVAGNAVAQTFDNRSVIALTQAGLGDATIMTKVDSLPCGYDVSTDGLIALKKAGVADPVIAAMVGRCTASSRAQGLDNGSSDPMIKHAPGIYMAQEWLDQPRLAIIRPAIGSGNRTSGNGSVLFPLKSMLTVPQTESRNVAASSRPTFYFYFDTADRNVSDFGTERSLAAQSPSEFNLVKFKLKNGSREIEVGRMSAYFSVSMRKGVQGKDATAFSADEIGDGIFKVSANEPMPAGEYAFVFSADSGKSRVYDFSVRPPAVETRTGTK